MAEPYSNGNATEPPEGLPRLLAENSAATKEQYIIDQGDPEGHELSGNCASGKDGLGEGGQSLDLATLRLEVLCGITVALAQVPEAVAFSFVAGVDPYVGLTAAWIIGTITAVAGGRPAMISGATGAIAAVTGDLVRAHGVEYLLYAVILMGFIQLFLGAIQAAQLAKLISHSVMIGFCNGLALVIGLAQFHSYKRPDGSSVEEGDRRLGGAFGAFDEGGWIMDSVAAWAGIITVVAFLTCVLFPKITNKVPSSMMAVVVSIFIEWVIVRQLGFKTYLVSDFATVKGTLPLPVWVDPRYTMPPLDFYTLEAIFPVAVVMAIIGLIESVMTLNLVDEVTQTRGNPTRECLGQGLANVVCGIFGGMGGCAMIGQAMINVESGGRTRISSFVAGVFLLLILLALYPVINAIPVAALAGVMFNVCYVTFEWHSLCVIVFSLPRATRLLGRGHTKMVRLADAFVIVVVTVVTLFSNLAVAVFAGILFGALTFCWDSGKAVTCYTEVEVDSGGNVTKQIYNVRGPIFFASTDTFLEQFDAFSAPLTNVLCFEQSSISDYSGLMALNTLSERFGRYEKSITISGVVDPVSKELLRKGRALLNKNIQIEVQGTEKCPDAKE